MKLYLVAAAVFLVPWEIHAKQARDDWIDPNDMLNFDPSTGKMKNKKVVEEDIPEMTATPVSATKPTTVVCPKCPEPIQPPPRECTCEQAALPLMRQYIKTLLSHLDGQMPFGKSEDYTIHATLSEEDTGTLQRFVDTGNHKHIHDAHDILAGMIKQMSTSRLGRMEKMFLWLEDRMGVSLHRVVQLFALLVLASLFSLVESRLHIGWRRRITQIIVILFLISVPWTWYDLYKQAEVKQQSVAAKDMPRECQDGGESYWSYVKSVFTFQEDKCHAYYEHLLVDPLVKVPPTKAIAITFVRFFVSPLKDVGTAISEFIRALLIDLPLTLYPVALVMVGLFFFLLLFMGFGYRIRLPFFLTIEPSARPSVTGGDQQLQQAIADTNQRVAQQLEALQQKLESSEMMMSDKLQHLQQVQQAAIEYTIASSPSSPSPPSPSISRSSASNDLPRSSHGHKSKYQKYETAETVSMAMPPVKSSLLFKADDSVAGDEPDVNAESEMSNNSGVDECVERVESGGGCVSSAADNLAGSSMAVAGSKCPVDTLVPNQSHDSSNKS